ncbi:MerR family transcriptional regulator [Pseudogemmobacter blasticus]|uniref:MerR family transcriptional regulator n=1 Tax=Fuscovulum blasticum TaxID=1075 RepID=UPI0015E7C9EB|nr:MerR family transcriptional regulator [Fuscovulum blasticum]
MDKSPEAFRTISEVAEALETPAHVLRFWESRFPQIRPVKRAGGRRYYRPSDIALLAGIKRLLHDEGMTIRGVQKILREQGIRHVSGLVEELGPVEDSGLVDDAAQEERGNEPIPFPGPLRDGSATAEIDPAASEPADQDGLNTAFPETLTTEGPDDEGAFADMEDATDAGQASPDVLQDVDAVPSTAEVVNLFPEEESDTSVQFSLFGDEGEDLPAAKPAFPAATGPDASAPPAAPIRAEPPVAEGLPAVEDVEEAPFTEVDDWASASVDDFAADLPSEAPFEGVTVSGEDAADPKDFGLPDAAPVFAAPPAVADRDEPAADRPAIAARVRRMAESTLELEEPTATLAARLRALPLGSLNPKAKALAEIAARAAALRARLGPPHAS